MGEKDRGNKGRREVKKGRRGGWKEGKLKEMEGKWN